MHPGSQGKRRLSNQGSWVSGGKAAGCNTREPRSSLESKIEDADPMDVRGRPMHPDKYNGAGWVIFRGSRGGMWRRIGSPVLEVLCGDAARASTEAYKETKSRKVMKGVGGVHSTD